MADHNSPEFSRKQFRQILGSVVDCLRGHLADPGVSPFDPAEIAQWLNQVTAEDIAAVWDNARGED
jgi:hypothetical protein